MRNAETPRNNAARRRVQWKYNHDLRRPQRRRPHPNRLAREYRFVWTWGRTDQPAIRNKLALFGEGPWLNEPDRVEWVERGFMCMIVRNGKFGHWCGYVGVLEDHPWYQQPHGFYDDVGVHGGVTKTVLGKVHMRDESIWWIGFDCVHYRDFSPGLMRWISPGLMRWMQFGIPDLTYREEAFVRAQVQDLAQQASAELPGSGPVVQDSASRKDR